VTKAATRLLDVGTGEVQVRIELGVAYVTLNRPNRLNALTADMTDAFARALGALSTDDEVGCLVLAGAGAAFCAGGDVLSMGVANQSRSDVRELDLEIQKRRVRQRSVSAAIWEMPVPTIAAVTGPAAGAGLAIALACDLRFATPEAVFTTAFARVGLSGDYGGTWFLTQLVGTSKARELYYFSERIKAADALALGIVNGIVESHQMAEFVSGRATQIASGPRLAFAYMKENLNRAISGSLNECLDAEASSHTRSQSTKDHRAAAQAFAEKRTPVFVGR
jgi:2-(1,2-epoxy-1,2-dihydrophenyl)acetyl-CoA isomerase